MFQKLKTREILEAICETIFTVIISLIAILYFVGFFACVIVGAAWVIGKIIA